ncbi:MAG: hypothetical protein J2P35_04280 [Actinobacteria bacterium]|nr:hypothetical protein [Actinomycetota bacterium]MBO0788741.1 hypothetical protein [Actinomycetota bacterium]MBO0814405.1 hypothetical protein [Actinomycetota bacterium]
MPAAPQPRRPSVVTLYEAADILTGPGCPVCRYTAEAADRYLAWFALEGHGDADVITRLTASLGWCPRHTRDVMSQPGAATRLTAVYRYLLEGARERLRARKLRPAGCPACEHDRASAAAFLDGRVFGGCPPPAAPGPRGQLRPWEGR